MGVLWNPNSTGFGGQSFPDAALATGTVRAVAGRPSDLNALDRAKYRKTTGVTVTDPAGDAATVLNDRYDVIASGVSWEYGGVMP